MASAKTAAVVPFFVSFGAEPYLLDQDRRKAQRLAGREVVELVGTGLTDSQVVAACESVSVEDRERVVILDHAEDMKGTDALAAYIEAKDPHDKRVVLWALVRSEKLPEIWAKAGRMGRVLEHRKLKTWDTNNEVVKWITAEATRRGLTLAEGVADRLFLLVGSDLYRLANELGKLGLLSRKVTLEHLALAVPPTLPTEPFQVAEAAIGRDAGKAMNLLSLVYRTMGDDAHVPITAALMKQVEKMVVARQMIDQRAPDEDIALALGMNPWRCRTHFLPVVKRHTLGGLIAHMGRLARLDADVKGSAPSKRTRVELTVLAIAG